MQCVALLAALGAVATLPDLPGRTVARIDVLGALTGCCGIAALVYGFSEAGEYGWHTPRPFLCLGLAVR